MALIPSFFGGRRGNIFDPFSLDIWDPYTSEAPARETTSGSGVITPRIDWKETPEVHIIKAELPGVQKSEVRVEVEEGRVLQISGDFRQEKEDKNDKWHRVERVRGKFLRRFRLPEDAMMDQIKASMDNGVLTVVVPKAQEKKPEVKNIDISGA